MKNAGDHISYGIHVMLAPQPERIALCGERLGAFTSITRCSTDGQ